LSDHVQLKAGHGSSLYSNLTQTSNCFIKIDNKQKNMKDNVWIYKRIKQNRRSIGNIFPPPSLGSPHSPHSHSPQSLSLPSEECKGNFFDDFTWTPCCFSPLTAWLMANSVPVLAPSLKFRLVLVFRSFSVPYKWILIALESLYSLR
jgi:hypothetical protein